MRIESKKSDFWQKYLSLDDRHRHDTTTKDMLRSGLKHKPRQNIQENLNERRRIIRHRDDAFFPAKNVHRRKLPAVEHPAMSNHVINPEASASFHREQLTSEYLASYKEARPEGDQKVLRRYPKKYPEPIPGLKIKDNIFATGFKGRSGTDALEEEPPKTIEPWKHAFTMKSKNRFNLPRRVF